MSSIIPTIVYNSCNPVELFTLSTKIRITGGALLSSLHPEDLPRTKATHSLHRSLIYSMFFCAFLIILMFQHKQQQTSHQVCTHQPKARRAKWKLFPCYFHASKLLV